MYWNGEEFGEREKTMRSSSAINYSRADCPEKVRAINELVGNAYSDLDSNRFSLVDRSGRERLDESLELRRISFFHRLRPLFMAAILLE